MNQLLETRTHSLRFVASILAVVVVLPSVWAQGMGGASSHGKDMTTIHDLLRNSQKVQRSVRNVPGGIVASTESRDPRITAFIQTHTAAMVRRLKQGNSIRDWDPLFAALFAHRKQITIAVKNTNLGVEIRETSNDPYVVELIRSHGAAVTGFVRDGMPGMHKVHPLPVKPKRVPTQFLGKGDGVTTCPVTGEPIDKQVSATIEGRVVYFCCAGCIETVKKNPALYLRPKP